MSVVSVSSILGCESVWETLGELETAEMALCIFSLAAHVPTGRCSQFLLV